MCYFLDKFWPRFVVLMLQLYETRFWLGNLIFLCFSICFSFYNLLTDTVFPATGVIISLSLYNQNQTDWLKKQNKQKGWWRGVILFADLSGKSWKQFELIINYYFKTLKLNEILKTKRLFEFMHIVNVISFSLVFFLFVLNYFKTNFLLIFHRLWWLHIFFRILDGLNK